MTVFLREKYLKDGAKTIQRFETNVMKVEKFKILSEFFTSKKLNFDAFQKDVEFYNKKKELIGQNFSKFYKSNFKTIETLIYMNQFFHAAKPMFDLFENDMKCLNENQGADWKRNATRVMRSQTT